MSNDDTVYNGWSNYETWTVYLWLSNEADSQEYWERLKNKLKEEI